SGSRLVASDALARRGNGVGSLLSFLCQRRHPAVRRVDDQRRSPRAHDLLVAVVPELVVIAHDVGRLVLVVVESIRLRPCELFGLLLGKHVLFIEPTWPFERCGRREIPDTLHIGLPVRGSWRLVVLLRRRGSRARAG